MKQIRMAVTFFFVLVVFGSFFAGFATSPADAAEAIKVGWFGELTGSLAGVGKDSLNSVRLYLDSVGSAVSGRKIELLTEDTEGKPDVGLTKVRKLVEKDNVQVLIGPCGSGVALAVRDYIVEKKIPWLLGCVAAITKLTQEAKSPYIFRISFAEPQFVLPLVPYLSKKYRKISVVASDYASGHDLAERLAKMFTEKGGQIVQTIFIPLGTADMGPYLVRIRPQDADAVWAFFAGADAIRFVKQYNEFGLKDRLPLTSGGALTSEDVLPAQGDAALGVVTTFHYVSTIDNPENKKFVGAYKAKYGTEPAYGGEAGYVAARLLVDSLKSIGGAIEQTDRFLNAMKKANITAPRGPFKFDENQNPIMNAYILRVEKVGGKLQNTVIETIPNVGQYWTP